MKRGAVFLKKHSSTILTVVSAAGVVGTTVLAVKATPKALSLLDEAKEEKGGDLTVVETVKAAWKPYIPAAITGVSTIACIFGINYLNTKRQASLMSAYALLDSSYREFIEKTKELTEGKDINVKHEIVKSKFDEDMPLNEEKTLFFDWQSMRYFESTFEELKRAEYIFNQNLTMSGFACLNEFYDILGLPRVEQGYQLGWSTITNDDIYGYDSLEFEYEKTTLDDGTEEGIECWIMTMPCPPTLDYMY